MADCCKKALSFVLRFANTFLISTLPFFLCYLLISMIDGAGASGAFKYRSSVVVYSVPVLALVGIFCCAWFCKKKGTGAAVLGQVVLPALVDLAALLFWIFLAFCQKSA